MRTKISNFKALQTTPQLHQASLVASKGKQLPCPISSPKRTRCVRRSRANATSQVPSQAKKRTATQLRSMTTKTTKRKRPGSQSLSKLATDLGLQSRLIIANSQSTTQTSASLKLDALPRNPTLCSSNVPFGSYSFQPNFAPTSLSFSLPSCTLPTQSFQQGARSNQSIQQGTLSNVSSNTITTLAIPNLISSSFSTSCSTSSATLAVCRPLLIDPMSYISEVFDNIFAPQIIAQTPLLKQIRVILIKKLLFDHANNELLSRSLSCFEEVHDFTLEILSRSNLLS